MSCGNDGDQFSTTRRCVGSSPHIEDHFQMQTDINNKLSKCRYNFGNFMKCLNKQRTEDKGRFGWHQFRLNSSESE